MDVAHPIRVVVPTLDGQVLQALASTTSPLTGRRLWRMAEAGSEAGVRRCLNRLTEQGLVSASQAGQAWLYVGNRQHIAWPAVELLADLRATLRHRMTTALEEWSVPPLVAGVFGSAARRDGHAGSDIDVLVIRPDDLRTDSPDGRTWETQTGNLVRSVKAWTGNVASLFEIDRARAVEIVAQEDLGDSWARDLDVLVGESSWRDIQRDGRRERPDLPGATSTRVS